MRALSVVVLDPGSDLGPSGGQTHEWRIVKQLIAHATIRCALRLRIAPASFNRLTTRAAPSLLP